MRNDHLRNAVREDAEALLRAVDLRCVYTTVFERQRARRIDAQDGNFIVNEPRLQVVSDISAIPGERSHESRDCVIERDIMVARNNYLRHWQPVQERAGCLELPS